MPTHAELATKLLKEAADFFEKIGSQNDEIKGQMQEYSVAFSQLAQLLGNNPEGDLNGAPLAEMAGKMLIDAAGFFRSLGEQNEPLKEQMEQNANIYQEIGQRVMADPKGEIE